MKIEFCDLTLIADIEFSTISSFVPEKILETIPEFAQYKDLFLNEPIFSVDVLNNLQNTRSHIPRTLRALFSSIAKKCRKSNTSYFRFINVPEKYFN